MCGKHYLAMRTGHSADTMYCVEQILAVLPEQVTADV